MIKNVRTISGCTLVLVLVTLLGCQAAPPTATLLPPTATPLPPTATPTPMPPTPTPEPEPWQQRARMFSSAGGPAASVVDGKI